MYIRHDKVWAVFRKEDRPLIFRGGVFEKIARDPESGLMRVTQKRHNTETTMGLPRKFIYPPPPRVQIEVPSFRTQTEVPFGSSLKFV